MAFFSELEQHVRVLRDSLGEDLDAHDLARVTDLLGDDAVVAVLAAATALVRAGEKVRIAASGVAGARSTRDAGHSGLAQIRGHRSPVSLVQEITGSTRAEAVRQVRLGEALRDAAGVEQPALCDEPRQDERPTAVSWHAPLAEALLEGEIGAAQHDAILRGLGEPPLSDDPAAASDAWAAAARQLLDESRERTAEELGRAARTIRDLLDPEGAARRFDERFEARAFRLWRDADGIRRGSVVFDDLGGAWAQSLLDSALRPRRGGPRFVDPDAKSAADSLVDDPRTNDQLAYDLLLDVLRAGTLADASAVLGTRQAGVRIVLTKAALDTDSPAVALLEDDQAAIPAWLAAQQRCDSGTVECTTDTAGNPLDLGREARLYTTRQRVALGIRDGGCRWRGCDRPASACEAHHIDPFGEGGRTDVDRGILLCRWHHMHLHNGGWRITRDGRDDFVLHPPSGRGDPITLVSRLALRWAWSDADPPPPRFRPAA